MVSLRPYQQDLLDGIRAEMRRGHRRIVAVMPTGAGKGTTIAAMVRSAAAKGMRTLILAHRAELIDQLSETADRWGVPHGIIAAGRSMDLSQLVQVGSVQTVVRRLDKIPAPQLIIQDEAHHVLTGNTWGKVINHWPNAYLVGKTATPSRSSGEGLGEGHGGFFTAMVLGPDTAWLTANGFLAPARVFAPPGALDTSKLRTRAGDFRMDDAERQLEEGGIMGDAVTHYQRHIFPGTAIAFCCSIAHAEAVAEAFQAQGIRAHSIDGTMDKTERRRLIAQLGTGEVQVLTSCMIISEGTDVPSVSGAIMLRPTQSLALYLQMVGRALRPAPGKVAVINDHVGNSLRHGLPTDPREWTLEGKAKRQRDAAPPVKVCPGCFAAIPSASRECPECGHAFEAEKREYITVEGDLVERTFKPGESVEWLRDGAWQGGWRIVSLADEAGQWWIDDQRGAMRKTPASQLRYPLKRQRATAQTMDELIAIGRQRGMSNPAGWARHVMAARQTKGQWNRRAV